MRCQAHELFLILRSRNPSWLILSLKVDWSLVLFCKVLWGRCIRNNPRWFFEIWSLLLTIEDYPWRIKIWYTLSWSLNLNNWLLCNASEWFLLAESYPLWIFIQIILRARPCQSGPFLKIDVLLRKFAIPDRDGLSPFRDELILPGKLGLLMGRCYFSHPYNTWLTFFQDSVYFTFI